VNVVTGMVLARDRVCRLRVIQCSVVQAKDWFRSSAATASVSNLSPEQMRM
jgi:hypothetical protein